MWKKLKDAIDTLELSNWITIWIVEWKLSYYDIRVKYKDNNWTSHWRQPKHIHWIVDWMLKREHNIEKIKELVIFFQKLWDENSPEKATEILKSLYKKEKKLNDLFLNLLDDIRQFEELNSNWYYHVDFLIFSWYLLLLQEKNNRTDAYMFQKMFSALWKDYSDLYQIITDATSNYWKK